MFNLLTTRASGESIWKRLDWVLLASSLALSFVGAIAVWTTSRPNLIAEGTDPNAYLKREILFIAIGLLLALWVARSRYTILRAYAPVLYVLGVIGLVAVLLIGFEQNGIRAWIRLPFGFTLQPAEFAKLAIVLGAALVLSETRTTSTEPENREVILTLLITAAPVLLIMLQPDLGTTLVIGVLTLGLLSVSGTSARWLLGLGGTAVIGIVTVLAVPGLLQDYQKKRLSVFLDPSIDPQGAGYNLKQVRLAIGSGGWFGTGPFRGPQTNGRFIPEQQTDFIYSAIGEQFGFIGAGLVIIGLFLVCWRALKIAFETTDRFGRIAATGIACWFAFQAFENIGMNIGIMPVTGVPLPFISYGGSSMFACWMAVGLLQNIKTREPG
jgi:rod shape determining protein RodA